MRKQVAKKHVEKRLGSIVKRKRSAMTIDGLPVKNMKKPIKLLISDQDCRNGNKKTPNSCAAALACTRQIPNCTEARIHIGRIFLRVREGKKEYWLRGKTPNALRTEIATFDRGGSFEPGFYNINPLSPSEAPSGKAEGTPPKFVHGRPGKHRRKPKILQNVRSNAHGEYRLT